MKHMLLLCVAGALAGCGPDEAPQTESATTDTTSTMTAGQVPLITEHGIGAARAGRTLGEVRKALPAGTRLGEVDQLFLVDIAAIPVISGADTLYHLLFYSDAEIADSTHIELVATLHESVRTQEGVGPGMALADAAEVYGAPVISHNVNDESREYAEFPRYAHNNVSFRVRPPSDDQTFAGVYATEDEHNSTADYYTGSSIYMVLVNLVARP